MTAIHASRRTRSFIAVFALLALAASWLAIGGAKAHALNGKVLIVDTAFWADADFNEADAAESLGLGADVVTSEQWAAMTTSDFAQYDAIVLTDNDCENDGITALAAPLANLATWAPAVTGNIFVTTSDATFHANEGVSGAEVQITRGIGYAAAQGVTGLYVTSSCYDDDTWMTILDAFSPGWTASEQDADDIHVTGSAAELAGLDDAALFDYGDTVHHFIDSWPSDFTVYAIAVDTTVESSQDGSANAAATITGPYDAPDGTTGAPVIVIRGAATSPSHILLQPDTQTNDVSAPAHLTATVTDPTMVVAAAADVSGITVTFTAVSGPNAGKTAEGVTDADGNVTIDQTSAVAGTDTWEASFVDPAELTEVSNQVTVIWTAATPTPTPTPAPAVVVPPRFTG